MVYTYIVRLVLYIVDSNTTYIPSAQESARLGFSAEIQIMFGTVCSQAALPTQIAWNEGNAAQKCLQCTENVCLLSGARGGRRVHRFNDDLHIPHPMAFILSTRHLRKKGKTVFNVPKL